MNFSRSRRALRPRKWAGAAAGAIAAVFCLSFVRATAWASEPPISASEPLASDCLKRELAAFLTQNEAEVARLLARRGLHERQETQFGGIDGHAVAIDHATPAVARAIVADAGRVFRHYTPPAAATAIIAEGQLRAGHLPYIQVSAGSRVTWPRLTGVFLTLPEFSPDAVGVDRALAHSFVDLSLPPGVQLLELERGILLVPGAPTLPAWVQTNYRAWLAGETVPSYMISTLHQLHAQGGLRTPLAVPILVRR